MNNKIIISIIAIYSIVVIAIICQGLYPGFFSEDMIIPSLLGEVEFDGVKINVPDGYRVIKRDNIVILIPWNESYFDKNNNDRIIIKKYDKKTDVDIFKGAKTVKIGNYKAKMRVLRSGNEFGYASYLLDYQGKKFVIFPSTEEKKEGSEYIFKKNQKVNQKLIAEIFNIKN